MFICYANVLFIRCIPLGVWGLAAFFLLNWVHVTAKPKKRATKKTYILEVIVFKLLEIMMVKSQFNSILVYSLSYPLTFSHGNKGHTYGY